MEKMVRTAIFSFTVGALFVFVVYGLDYLTGGKLLPKEKIIKSGYFYLETSGCLQRPQLITDFQTFEYYCNEYNDSNNVPSDGVRLIAFSSISVNPFDEVHILELDTTENEIIYAKAYQLVGKKKRKEEGYIFYDYFRTEPPNSNTKFCTQYLDAPWSGKGSSPDPRHSKY